MFQQDVDRCIYWAISLTETNDRTLTATLDAPKTNEESNEIIEDSLQLFGDMMHEFAEILAEKNYFADQQKNPLPDLPDAQIQLISDGDFVIAVEIQEKIHECIIHDVEACVWVAFLEKAADRTEILKKCVENALDQGVDVHALKKSSATLYFITDNCV